MKEVKDIVEFLFGQNNPWLVAFVVLSVSPFMYKVVREILNLSHGVKEKKLLSLLTYVDGGLANKPRFSVEQVFHQNYGLLLSFDEIQHLLALDAPSHAVRDYAWGRSYLRFDPQSKSIAWLKPVRFRLRAFLLMVLFVVAYVSSLIALLFFLASVASKSPIEYITNSVTILSFMVPWVVFFVRDESSYCS
jgi:hypothetical protein